MTGLLLPLWDRLPPENMPVCRLTADDGQALIGRTVTAEQAIAFRGACGLGGGQGMTPDELDAAILVRGGSFPLANGWKLARHSIDRIEVEGPTDADLPALKRPGCVAEVLTWKTHAFVPGADVLERLIERYPVVPIPPARTDADAPFVRTTGRPYSYRQPGTGRRGAADHITGDCHAHLGTLPDDPVYPFCPAYEPPAAAAEPATSRSPWSHSPSATPNVSATGSTGASVSTAPYGPNSPGDPCSPVSTKAGRIEGQRGLRERNRRRTPAAVPSRQRYAQRPVTSSHPWAEHCPGPCRKGYRHWFWRASRHLVCRFRPCRYLFSP